MSYSPSPHSYEGGYSPSPFLQTNNLNIPAHLLRSNQPTNQSTNQSINQPPRQYHGNTPISSGSYIRSSTPVSINPSLNSLNQSTNQSINQSVNRPVKTGLRYAGGYEIGPVMGVGTYGEVRQGRSIDGLNYQSMNQSINDLDDQSTNQSINQLPPGALVAIKLIDLNRFTEDTADLVRKEIRLLEMINQSINQPTNQSANQSTNQSTNKNVVRLIECIEDVAYTGEWCDSCACTQYIRSVNQSTNQSICQNCSHPSNEHTKTETRPVLMLVQELLCGGELFGLLMHTGPLPEDLARFYFRQLIDGLQMLHEMNIVHRDLKPENLCLDANFDLKIIDFGLAAIEEPCLSLIDPSMRHQLINQSTNQSINQLSNSPSSRARSGSLHQNPILKQSPHSSPLFGSTNQSINQSIPPSLTPHPLQYSGVGSLPYAPPEVYYVHSLFGGSGYRGALADLWSCAIILFVTLIGRPPFMRPLLKTYGANYRKCRHFVNILNGEGYGQMSQGAKQFIQKMLVYQSIDRCSFQMIREDHWFNGPLPDTEERMKIMKERCETVWRKCEKPELIDLIQQCQQQETYFKAINQSINQSTHMNNTMSSINPTYNNNQSPRIQPFQSINQSYNQSINQSMNSSIRSGAIPIPIPRSVNQSIIQSINQPQLGTSFSLSSSMNESDEETSADINRTVRRLNLQ